jgi:putative ABC transport system ATP-binding protein
MSDRPAASRAAGVADEAPQVMVAVSGVSREFGSGHTATRALREVSFTVRRGQLVTVCGRPGSGKTSPLNIIGGLDLPTSGSVTVAGQEVTR